MLEFYDFNTLNVCIILISSFVIYNILLSLLKKDKDSEDNSFSLEYLIISILVSVGISILIAYILSSKDETILTDNYWDPIGLQKWARLWLLDAHLYRIRKKTVHKNQIGLPTTLQKHLYYSNPLK